MRQFICRLAVSVALLQTLLVVAASAQHDTKGRDFWVTFMTNLGGGQVQQSDMRLYLASEVPTTARVIYFGGADTMVVPIPKARTTVAVDITGRFGPLAELQLFEEFSAKAIEVISDDEITCYGVSIRLQSADAFLALPDDVLTNAYIVLAYPNGYDSRGARDYDTPSQFAIIGTEDGTTVRITPAAQLNGRTNQPFTITLDRGEVFNGQAAVGRYQDVSGTEIKSNKPVAVYAGNQRTSVPVRVGNYRDHLVEQMPPLEVWGKSAIVTPHFPITPQSSDTAVVRVLAAFDNTRWQIDGVDQPPLRRAVSVEIPLLRAMNITASDPILVAQYVHSVAVSFGNTTLLGDPFMMVIPPTEQFDTAYAFQSIDHNEFDDNAHFINVVIPTVATSSVRLDDASVSATWTPVPTTSFSFAQIRVRRGSHTIAADSSFGLYVYGFGRASSYGYAGGMLFRRLVNDFQPPEIEQTLGCLGLDGVAFDSHITDSGIDSLYLLPSSRNVTVAIDPFAPGADSVAYRARLTDPYQDGLVELKVVDSAGRSRTQSNPIPGFTVRTVGMSGNAPLALDTLHLLNAADTCFDVTLENVGRFPQTITSIVLVPPIPGATVTSSLPLVIAPGSRASVTICARAFADTVLDATLVIANACTDRTVATLPIVSGVDTLPPTISTRDAGCDRHVFLTVADARGRSSLVAAATFDTLVNARVVAQRPAGDGFPVANAEFELAPIDDFHDLVYVLRVADLAGNIAVYRDTIGGFTIAALDADRDSVSMRFGRELRLAGLDPSEERCDSVTLVNYGARALRIVTVRFESNRQYSVPPSQLPLVIAPHATVRLTFCTEAGALGLVSDTLIISDGCREDRVVMKTPVVTRLTTVDGCNDILQVGNIGGAKRAFLSAPHPNPNAGALATLDIGLPEDADVTLEIAGSDGATRGALVRGATLRAGIHRLTFDVSSLEDGVYFFRLRLSSGGARPEELVEKLVVRR
jgi:hypothetical protein